MIYNQEHYTFPAAEIKKLPQSERIGIIVLNRNRSHEVLECIRSIYNQCHKLFTIVVVDNDSSDNSCELIKSTYPDVCLIENKKNYGVAGGRNIGIQFLARNSRNHDFIMFLDNDVVLEKYCIQEMIYSFKTRKNIGIVTPKLLKPDGTFEYAGGLVLNLSTGMIANIGSGQKDAGQYDNYSESLASSGGIFMIRRDVLDESGWFDENFNPYGWEDVDLSLRVRKKGYKIFYNYKAVMYHKGGKSIRGFISEYEQSKVRNFFYLVKKHNTPFEMILFYIMLPLRLLLTSGKQIHNGESRFIVPQLFSLIKVLFGKSR